MTLNEARYVWDNRAYYDAKTVALAVEVLEHAGEL